MNQRRGRQGRERALIAQNVLRSIFVELPRDQKSQRSQPRQGRCPSKEHRRRSSKDSRGPPSAPGSILRGGTRHDGSVRWDEWICPLCSKKNFLTNKNCGQCQGLPNEQQKLAGAGGTARHANIPPPGTPGPIGLTAPSPTTGSELKQQVSKLEAMKKTAQEFGDQEFGDQELLTNIEDKLRHAQAAKAESRPWGAQLDSALANLKKAKLQIERAQENVDRAQDDLHAAKTHKAEAENRDQKLRELVAQNPEMTQQTADDLTALIQLTDQLSAQMRQDQVSQAGGPLLAQLQQGLRASAANRSRKASRSRSISSGSTPPRSRNQSLDIVMTETELDLLASRYDAA